MPKAAADQAGSLHVTVPMLRSTAAMSSLGRIGFIKIKC